MPVVISGGWGRTCTCAVSGMVWAQPSDWTHLPLSSRLHSPIQAGAGSALHLHPWLAQNKKFYKLYLRGFEEQDARYKYGHQAGKWKRATTCERPASGHRFMIFVRRMLQQALKVSGRSASPLVKWMERWAEGASARLEGTKAVRTLDDMPGPSVASFAWDLFAKRGLSQLHELQVQWWQRKRGGKTL